jgi:glycosyltransferase involved in cell wall biosynthesis
MKVVHLPYGYFPDVGGGTEIYVRGLIRELKRRGIEGSVFAPGRQAARYEDEGIAVRRFVVGPVRDVSDLYGPGDPESARQLADMLEEERPELVHLHAYNRGISLLSVHEARCRNLPVVLSYHHAGVTCQRGTMMQGGRRPCRGSLEVRTCSRCSLHGLGLSRLTSFLMGSLPPGLGLRLRRWGRTGGAWTALRMTDLMRTRIEATRSLLEQVDHFIVPRGWVRDVLLENGVAAARITTCPQGVESGQPRPSPPRGPGPLRIAYLGVFDPAKGPDLLVDALLLLPGLPAELALFGEARDERQDRYLRTLRRRAKEDGRIQFHAPVPHAEVPRLLDGFDVIAIPSRLLETGPLVALDGFAAGLPVLGSALGGVAELVQHEINGLLVYASTPRAWAEAIGRLVREPDTLRRLRAGVRPPRTLSQVADEIQNLYRRLIRERAAT